MKLELYIYMQLTTVYFDSAPYILIAVGCAIVVVGSLGCLCTIKGFPALLYLVRTFTVNHIHLHALPSPPLPHAAPGFYTEHLSQDNVR